MSQLPRGDHEWVVTNAAKWNDFGPRPLDIVLRVYFSGEQDVNELIVNLEDYISYNNIQDRNRYLELECLLKGDVLL